MGNAYCIGRKCELAWGYNESLKKLLPVNENPPNIRSTNDDTHIYNVFHLSSTVFQCWVCLYFVERMQ